MGAAHPGVCRARGFTPSPGWDRGYLQHFPAPSPRFCLSPSPLMSWDLPICCQAAVSPAPLSPAPVLAGGEAPSIPISDFRGSADESAG